MTNGAGDERAVDWVVFDLGNVVLTATKAMPLLAARLGVPANRLAESYGYGRREYDRTSAADRYWHGVAHAVGAATPSDALVRELTRIDDHGWSVADPAVLHLINDLHDAGARLAVLSNAPSSMGKLIRGQKWARPFAHFLISGDLGTVKPESEIYAALLGATGGRPDRMVFLDDLPTNIDGAKSAGLFGFVFTEPATARSDLRTLGLPV